jgi:hypothetical protein
MAREIRPAWQPADPIATWLAIGETNRWICRAVDPPFDRRSFNVCADAAELEARFVHGNWCLGSAFYLGNLCFIQQVDGGDEWLGIKENVAFESASCAAMIAAGTFRDFLSDVQGATLEQCATLTYRRTVRLA